MSTDDRPSRTNEQKLEEKSLLGSSYAFTNGLQGTEKTSAELADTDDD